MLPLTIFALLGLGSFAFADVGHDKDGKLVVSNQQAEKEDFSQISLKEICYRNLYADVDEFQVKHSTEALVSDTSGATVFLSDGLKKDVDDKEYYYEEFCYKKYKAREHDKDVQKNSGLLVGRQVPDSSAILSSSFSDNVGGVPGSSGDAVLANSNSDAPESDAEMFKKRQMLDGVADSNSDAPESDAEVLKKRQRLDGLDDPNADAPESDPEVLKKRQMLNGLGGLGGFDDMSGALDTFGGAGDSFQANELFAPVDFLASIIGNATDAHGGDDARILPQPLRSGDEGLSGAQDASKDARVQDKSTKVEKRSPGWIVRVMRLVSVTWDGEDDQGEEGCAEGEDEAEGLDDGPQEGIVFE